MMSPASAVCLALAVALLAGSSSAVGPLTLTTPDVDIDTHYYGYFDASLGTSGRNVTVFEVYRINSVLAYSLAGDNAASPGGEIGFITEEYGQTSGYVLRSCVEVVLPEGTGLDTIQHGNDAAFASYECCGGGSCNNCGYTGSGTNPDPKMVGRSYNLDKPYFAPGMAKAYGWWYSFNNHGHCASNETLDTNGCTWRQSPYVDSVLLQDVNVLPQWTNSPSDQAQYQTINNMLINAFDTPLMTSYTYNSAANQYTPLNGQFRADPSKKCRVSCAKGTYSATGFLQAFSNSGMCAACPAGTYADQLGSTSCQACPAGTTTNAAGAVSSAACFSSSTPVCAAGTYNEYTGHAPCKACPAGTYQTMHSAQTCVACPAYTTSNIVGASSASSCVLNPPQAVMVYAYSQTNAAGSIAGNPVGADIQGAINYLQASYYGQTIAESGTVSVQCVEAVNQPFFTPSYSCFNSYCSSYAYAGNTANLPINGTAAINDSPYFNNGNWYLFPQAAQCSNSQLPGQGGCTWKASTVVYEQNLGALINNTGFYSCPVENQFGYCYQSLTPAQWDNSTTALYNYQKNFNISSTIVNATSSVMGPVSIENGRCVVQCPSGYTFRSAFTAPYCVPTTTTTTSTFLASDVDASAVDVNAGKSSMASLVGAAVAVVAIVAVVGVLVAHRMSHRQRGTILLN